MADFGLDSHRRPYWGHKLTTAQKFKAISVLVPASPFTPDGLSDVRHCLAALDVEQLMEWWPGNPHIPHRDAKKVQAIQRSLDWKRVAQIAAYLLQEEIRDAPERLDRYFKRIYEPKRLDKGRQWPPAVPRVIGYEKSEYPTFSNVLLHVNGAKVANAGQGKTATLTFDENSPSLHFSVIDGQHRINGAYLAVQILKETLTPSTTWEIPAEVFLDLDRPGDPPRRQAQIFIDVNFYQKKVDRSLVADLFPTARGARGPLDAKERAQDIGRKLMLEVGPLVGMIQIPGIRFGVNDVVSLATLNSAIEDVLPFLERVGITGLTEQVEFIAQVLSAWVEASGRAHDLEHSTNLDPENVAYQGRVIVSVLTLMPACIAKLRSKKRMLVSPAATADLRVFFRTVIANAGLQKNGQFLGKSDYRKKGYLGSGGIGRFRDSLWAATSKRLPPHSNPDRVSDWAIAARSAALKACGDSE